MSIAELIKKDANITLAMIHNRNENLPKPHIQNLSKLNIPEKNIPKQPGFKNIGELLEYAASKNISKERLKINI